MSRSAPDESRWLRLGSVAILLSTFFAPSIPKAADLPVGIVRGSELQAQQTLPLVSAPAPNLAALATEDLEREAAGLAPRYAVPYAVAITPETHGVWEALADGTAIWRLRVGSPGALSLNFGYSRFQMTPGGRLQLYTADHTEIVRAITAADNAAHGEFWSPVLRADEVVLEVVLPAEERAALRLVLSSINVGYRAFGSDTGRSGACNVDVICSQGDAWRAEIPAVAVISTGGSLFCTGFMVNNTAQDLTPYFMTAYHCGISSTNAASLVAYWNYEASNCGGARDGSLTQWQSGSFFRSRYSTSDFTLVELDEDPNPAWGVTFAGWDRTGANATSAVAIHQPNTDEKAISFENQATQTTTYLGTSVPGDGTHVRIVDWDVGTTEPGSSGSPLFDQNHHIIGQLHGGFAACGNDSSDWYGKFAVSWAGGGTSTTRLSNWLDPGNSGANSVNTLVPGGCTNDAQCDDGLFCNGAETCAGTCQAGSNPCPGQGCDEGTNACVPLICDGDLTCESGENCTNCASDCIAGGGGAVCGNDVCETGAGETCTTCPADCNGVTGGNPNNRYCCGSSVSCSDPRCTGGGNSCSTGGGTAAYCCGDGSCGGAESSANCALDCGAPPTCGDTVCNGGAGETRCSCAADCGAPPASEAGLCSNGINDDCDGQTDCADSNCTSDPACITSCSPVGASCDANSDCCSNNCKGPAGRKTCR